MTTKKQARAREIERQRRYEEAAAAKAARRRRMTQVVAAIVIASLVLAGGLAIILVALNDKAPTAANPSATASSSTAPEPSTAPSSTADGAEDDAVAEDGAALTGWGASPEPPSPAIADQRTWTATLVTNQGDIVVEIDGEAAPQAAASFIALAGDDFFNATDCHRLTTTGIFVLQCGDPTGTGTGGPGYRFGPIENAPADDIYPAGTLAMARAGGDAESMGSQFFLVYQDSTIPADAAGGYTVFGHVLDGMDILNRVATTGTITGDPDGRPALSVIVNEVSVS